ncbi:MAG: sulfite exporter TauE/SafE family protein [Phycisphaerales bacterium]
MMLALAGSVLLASLVGSAHCAGMCGGIAAFCAGAGQCDGRRSAAATGLYHASRALSYVAVGALAGAFGTLLDAGGALVGVQRVAAVAAGVAVALVGVGVLASAGGFQTARMPLPEWMKRALGAVHRAAAAMSPPRRAIVVGLATPLLPCGWLWAFAAVAAGTGSVAGGALVMAAFWAGTVPILALVGAGIASLGGDRRRALAALAGVAMIGVGVYTAGVRAPLAPLVAQRLHDAPPDMARAANAGAVKDVKPACCQGADEEEEEAEEAPAIKPACCEEKPAS